MTAATLTVHVAPTVMRDYRKAGIALQSLGEGAVKDPLRLARSEPSGWRRRYARVARLNSMRGTSA